MGIGTTGHQQGRRRGSQSQLKALPSVSPVEGQGRLRGHVSVTVLCPLKAIYVQQFIHQCLSCFLPGDECLGSD